MTNGQFQGIDMSVDTSVLGERYRIPMFNAALPGQFSIRLRHFVDFHYKFILSWANVKGVAIIRHV
jgi:hypothetical protein